MLREYEFTLIAKGDLIEAERAKVFSKYEEIFKREGGEILERNDWGVKKMAYPIKKSAKGHYVWYDLACVPENLAECERLMRIDDNVLRFLAIKSKDSVNLEERKSEIAKKTPAAE